MTSHLRRNVIVLVATGVALAAALVGLLVAREGRPDRTCRSGWGAQICLVDQGHAYRIEGKGFMPDDDVQISFGSEEPWHLKADSEGRIPGIPGGVAGILPADRPKLLTVMGNGASGEAVYFEMTVCGVSAGGRQAC